MKFLFSTGCLYELPIEEIFHVARDAGFDGCELVVGSHFNNDRYIDRIKACTEILPVYTIHAPFVQVKAWGSKVNALKQTVELAASLGAEVVTFHPPSWLAIEINFYQWFKKTEDFQKELGLAHMFLAIENMPRMGKLRKFSHYLLSDIEYLINFGIGRNLYFTFDITHMATFEDDTIASLLRIFKTGRLKNIHISDYSNFRSHLFPGRGDLPIAKLLNTVRQVGYDGMLTLEVSPRELPKTSDLLVKMANFQLSYLKLHTGRS
ncbi:MAG: sugar phosphate isomerase/epimerase [Syntrophus sp. (in: bacteria)]|nr:sugar phosphate isomerase/epimerase [Syntrophus sp. (in: bacteria)]